MTDSLWEAYSNRHIGLNPEKDYRERELTPYCSELKLWLRSGKCSKNDAERLRAKFLKFSIAPKVRGVHLKIINET